MLNIYKDAGISDEVFYFGEKINGIQSVAYGLIICAVVVFNLAYLQVKNGVKHAQ